MSAPHLEHRSPLVGGERGAQALRCLKKRSEGGTPGCYGHVAWGSGTGRPEPHRTGTAQTASEQHWVGGEGSQQKSKAGCSYPVGFQESTWQSSGVSAHPQCQSVHQPPKRGNSNTTDWTSCALKYRYRGKAEFLTPASPRPLSPVPGRQLLLQIVGWVLLKAGLLGAQLLGTSSSRSPFTLGRNASLDYSSRHAIGGTRTTRSSAGWLGGDEPH